MPKPVKRIFKQDWPQAIVVNIAVEECDLYVGRSSLGCHLLNAKPGENGWLGNPHRLPKPFTIQELTRVIDQYRADFYRKVLNDALFKSVLISLIKSRANDGIIRLGCFCAPNPCHGDVIANWINR